MGREKRTNQRRFREYLPNTFFDTLEWDDFMAIIV